ncbi:uncharacterized protein LOC113491934 [Trichoplusia ni]|uniref:Uncharacterized protein LOC113491934 n=1 Tax=Trichoplusia ni TaxID=7111 RepID=A0A7E5V9J2_TRINI|nr:uncharacterized protein LOC113491934 [Trichoplusia ni]
MAKEMMIVFVYDTLCCTAEEDDPINAVLYFHPGWVSDTQRHALAGQVVGAAHCIKTLFSQPVAITLQSGKFIIREYGRYILAIGSDRNIPDWVLKNRANLLTSMIKVYHGDLQVLAEQMEDQRRLSEKLYQVFETYLPVLQYGCHIFQRVPMLTLPKSATSIYMESMQILEHCRKSKGVLGGVILYNNKIISTQLPPGLTSYLTVVDPYRIKSPAETLQTETPLPLGAQLLVVYVGKKLYNNLKKEVEKLQEFHENGEEMIAKFKKNQEAEREKFPQSGMKRDKSLLFTAVPEEDHSMISPPSREERNPDEERKPRPATMPDVVPFTNKPRPRPNKLSLSFKTQISLDEDVQENEKVFTGQTSVCSTPMVEYKRLHGNMLSICQVPENQQDKTVMEPDVLKNIEESSKINLENEKRDNKMVLDINCIADHYINKPEPIRKLASVTDLQESIKKLSNRATSKFKLKWSKASLNDDSPSPEHNSKNPSTMTINDPLFPVFRNDGVAISESLFNQYLEQHYSKMKQDSNDNMFTFNMKLCEQEKFEDFDSELNRSPQRTPKKKVKDSTKTLPTDQSRRKSLSLPLKSLNESTDSQIGSENGSEATSLKKKLTGVQLTPLMEKLSHLAFSDKSSGYSSRVMTPLELREFLTPAAEKQITFTDRPKPPTQDSESDEDSDSDLELLPDYSKHAVKCALFVSGLHNMALLALIDTEAANNVDTINSLWETSLNALGPIEQKCIEPLAAVGDATDYSYLTLDPDWGTVRKGGPWAALDIATMGLIHNDFAEDPELSEFILRSDESVVVGGQCGGAQIYYQELGARGAGPPPPSDALAAAPLRARRRLQRDHATLLL